jgi:hypothetical protein
MKYSEIAKPALKSFCEDLNSYLTNEKHIILYELKELISCFSLSDTIAIKGALEFKIHSTTRAENGTVTTLSETIIFSSKGYTIKSFSQEDHFGEYYTNNEYRINEEEAEEYISSYLKDALNSIFVILKDNNGYFEISNKKFDIK